MKLLIKFNNFWFNPDHRTRHLNRNIVYSFLFKGMGVLLSILFVPLTLGYLKSYEYGIWITIMTFVTWINYFDIGLNNGLRNKLGFSIAHNDIIKSREYISTTYGLLSIISFVLIIIFFIISSFVDWNKFLNVDNGIKNLKEVIDITFFCISLNFTLSTIGTIHTAFQNNWVNNLITFSGSLLAFIWISILKVTTEGSLLKVAIAFSVSPLIVNILVSIVTFSRIYRNFSPKTSYCKFTDCKDLFTLGIKFFFLQVTNLLLFSTSNILISKLFSPAEVTPYSIAYRYFNIISMLITSILSPLWAAITDAYARYDFDWIKHNMKKAIRIWQISNIFMLIMIIIANPVFRLWIGNKVTIPFSLIICVFLYTSVFNANNIYATYSNGIGNLKKSLLGMSIASIIYIPIAVLSSKYFGLNAIPLSLAISLLIPCFLMRYTYINSIHYNR